MSSSKVLLGFVVGAAVGAVAGLLLAPDKGSNTRKKFADKAGDWSDAAKETFNGIIDGVKNAYSSARDEMEEYADDVKTKASAAKSEVNSALS
jgi:gas vesicle protein